VLLKLEKLFHLSASFGLFRRSNGIIGISVRRNDKNRNRFFFIHYVAISGVYYVLVRSDEPDRTALDRIPPMR